MQLFKFEYVHALMRFENQRILNELLIKKFFAIILSDKNKIGYHTKFEVSKMFFMFWNKIS